MRTIIKKVVSFVLIYTGAAWVVSRFKRNRRGVRILTYHRVNDYPRNSGAISSGLTVSVKRFRKQMRFLAAYFHPISMERLCEGLQGRTRLPENAVVMTFDDGYFDNYAYALPILEEMRIPATVFLATDPITHAKPLWWDRLEAVVFDTPGDSFRFESTEFPVAMPSATEKERRELYKSLYGRLNLLDSRKREDILDRIVRDSSLEEGRVDSQRTATLSWENVKEMARSVFQLGAHTESHVVLSTIPDRRAEEEITRSKRAIEKHTGEKVVGFAYPCGGGETFNHRVVAALKRAGFRCAVTTIKGFVYPGDDPFALKRIVIDGEDDFNAFRCKVFGAFEWFGSFFKKVG